MEDFIAKIYRYSFVIDELEEFVELSDAGLLTEARNLYNKAIGDLEEILSYIAETNVVTANHIQSIAFEIKGVYEDISHTTGLVLGRLVPALYAYLDDGIRIDVTEGKYRFLSSDSGFLTVKDNNAGIYLHDTHNPLREAYRLINTRYSFDNENFLIFGCGLGYTAYQVYRQSHGAVKIYLFDDEEMLDYAYKYGVLSLIPDENIEVIHNPDVESLASLFLEKLRSTPSAGMFFAPYKRPYYDGVLNGELNRILINHEFELEVSRLYIINLWKNRNLSHISFEDVKKRYKYNEWVVISAGPSLDENIAFLKESKCRRGLIAVNTVLRRLLNEGIKPDIVAAADPSLSLESHIKGIEDITLDMVLIGDWVLSWKYAELYRGDICFVRTGASAGFTYDFLIKYPIWDISGTVACLAIEAAVGLGALKIWLVGQDLAYPEGQHYADGMPHSVDSDSTVKEKADGVIIQDNGMIRKREEVSSQINVSGYLGDDTVVNREKIQVLSVTGQMVDTCEAFIWFKKAIEHQIKKYSDVKFINMSTRGALIEGTHFS